MTGRAVKVDLPASLADDGSQNFLGWMRQLEVAIRTTVGSSGVELLRVHSVFMSKLTFSAKELP